MASSGRPEKWAQCGHQECPNCTKRKAERCQRNPLLCPGCRPNMAAKGDSQMSSLDKDFPARTRSRSDLGSTGATPHKDLSKRPKPVRPTISDITEAGGQARERLLSSAAAGSSSLETPAESLHSSERVIGIIRHSIAQLSGLLGRRIRLGQIVYYSGSFQ